MLEAEIYKALGDPVRIKILTRLATGPTYTIGEISKDLGVSRQGARKQLQVLVSANIVQLNKNGRETEVTLDTQKLKIARDFINQLEQQWDQRLDNLKLFVESDLKK